MCYICSIKVFKQRSHKLELIVEEKEKLRLVGDKSGEVVEVSEWEKMYEVVKEILKNE